LLDAGETPEDSSAEEIDAPQFAVGHQRLDIAGHRSDPRRDIRKVTAATAATHWRSARAPCSLRSSNLKPRRKAGVGDHAIVAAGVRPALEG